ncbi:hypothetical protein HY637_04250 [Candidatus Woesearchaeota archaeon]|nr:hypothetical protein [Candidatus Woesearchaeota archaeon]
MVDDDYGIVPYKDISDLKRELEGIREKKDISAKDLHEAVRKLTEIMSNMLGVFAAAAEELKLDDKEYEAENKKHETIISKLDKLIDQNKTIAEGMVAIVELVKEKFPQKEKEQQFFKPDDEEPAFVKPGLQAFRQPEFKPAPQPVQKPMPMAPVSSPSFAQPDFGLPPIEPEPLPDLDLPDEALLLAEEPKKKSLFGTMFKK